MRTSGIDNLQSCENWQNLYALLGMDKRSPYFSPQYYRAYSAVENHPAECFWAFQDEENYLFYPYLKRSINALGYELDREYYDLCGAYGYNGPIGFSNDQRFIEEFNSGLQSCFLNENVVTEFVRYSPIPENRHLHTYLEQIDVLDNVYVDLGLGLERLWSDSYEKNLRTSIRKGASYGLYSELFFGQDIPVPLLEEAYNIYAATMNRNKADEFYYFGMQFITKLHSEMCDNLCLILTYHEQVVVSFELLICDGILTYAILGGTLSDYYRLNPNTFQKNELFTGLIQHGYQLYSMGGGVSRSDNLYSYKKGFNKTCVNPFYIGIKVHIPRVYESIVTQWQRRFPNSASKYGAILQGYRRTD